MAQINDILAAIDQYVCSQGNQVGCEGLGDILKYFANKNGMSQLILRHDGGGSGITDLDGNPYNFAQILEAIKDKTKFVYMIYQEAFLLLPAISFFDDMVEFTGTHIMSEQPTIVRVSINSAEQIKDYYQALENDQSESLRIDPFVSIELTTEQAAAVGMNESVAMRIRNDVRPVISFNNNVEIAFNYTKKNNGSNVYTAIVFDAEANKKYAISLTLTSARAISYQVTEI